jgi:hypothetical protein
MRPPRRVLKPTHTLSKRRPLLHRSPLPRCPTIVRTQAEIQTVEVFTEDIKIPPGETGAAAAAVINAAIDSGAEGEQPTIGIFDLISWVEFLEACFGLRGTPRSPSAGPPSDRRPEVDGYLGGRHPPLGTAAATSKCLGARPDILNK